jgi:MFS family permease
MDLPSTNISEDKRLDSASRGYEKRLLRNVYVFSTTMGIMTLFFGWQNYQSIYLQHGLGASYLEVGVVYSVGYLAHALSGFPASLISDKHGRKKFVVAGTFINGFVYMSYALCSTWFLIMIPLFVMNLSHAAYINPMYAMLSESAPPRKRGVAFGAFQVISGIISLLAPVIALSIISQYGQDPIASVHFAMPFLYFMCGSTVAAMGVARGLGLRETHIGVLRPPQPLDIAHTSQETDAAPLSNKTGSQRDCEEPRLRSRAVAGFFVFVSLAAITSAVISNFIPLYVVNTHTLDNVQLTMFFIVSSLVSTLVQLPTGRLADSSRKKLMLLISVLLLALAILFYMGAHDFNGFIFAQVFFAAASTLLFNTEFTMISCYSRRRNRSTAFAIQTAIGDIVSIPFPLIGGLLISVSPQLLFMFTLTFTIPTFVAGLLLVHEPAKPTAE